MSRLTRDQRKAIIAEFTARHEGIYDPAEFVQEVRATGPSHPAYEYFDWDDAHAAQEHRIWQARTFVSDLRVNFQIEEIGRSGKITIREVDAPMMLSPRDGRKEGGGYYFMAPDDPDKMGEYVEQAAIALGSWLSRYRAALMHAGGSVAVIERQLRIMRPEDLAEAAE